MAKRNLDDASEDLPTEKKSRFEDNATAMERLVEIRMVVDSKEVGSIIGRGGMNVKRVREECNVYISVLKTNFENVVDRVMTIKADGPEAMAKAVLVVAQILSDARVQRDTKTNSVSEDSAKVTMKFLIHISQAGAIIGKGGELIRAMTTETGARVHLSTEPLPGTTEKTVSVTGVPDQIYAASLRILTQLVSFPPRNGNSIPYVPMPAAGGVMYQGAPAMQQTYDPYGQQSHDPYGQQSLPTPPYAAPTAPSGGYGGGYVPPPAAGVAGQTKQKIVIPTVCAGNVIGRGGSIISDIRNQSGTFISIAKEEPTAPHERVVTITGTTQGIQMAVYLIRQVVEQFQGDVPPQY
jgi:predicted RNA-binding protein YlqC (UPF0109 family)